MTPHGMATLAIGSAVLLAAPAAAEPLNTLADVGRALEACYVPPPREESLEGIEITVRFSFTRDGTILGEPRFTYVTRDIPLPIRIAYQKAAAAALSRCTPLSFTPGLAAAIPGRPFAWRIVDRRPLRKA